MDILVSDKKDIQLLSGKILIIITDYMNLFIYMYMYLCIYLYL
jgi:hypothetical protein